MFSKFWFEDTDDGNLIHPGCYLACGMCWQGKKGSLSKICKQNFGCSGGQILRTTVLSYLTEKRELVLWPVYFVINVSFSGQSSYYTTGNDLADKCQLHLSSLSINQSSFQTMK